MATLVASSANAGTGAASTTCTVTVPATSPDTLLVLFIAANSFAVSSISMGGGVWTQAYSGTNNSNFIKAYKGVNVAAGTTSGTITFAGVTDSGVQSMEWRGLTGTLGTNVSGFGTSTAVSAGPVTPGWGQNVVLGMFASNTGGVSGPSGGFTGQTPLVWVGARNMASGYLIQTNPTAATIGWTITSGAWDCTLAAFQAYEDIGYIPTSTPRSRARRRRLRQRFFDLWSSDSTVAAFTNASAEVATGTGAANNASITLAPNSGQGSGTGAAGGPSSTVAPTGAGSTGTGSASNPGGTVSVGGTGSAAGTGTANQPASNVAPNAGNSAGTGAANNPVLNLGPTSQAATGTGTANNPGGTISFTSQGASGTGAANAPTPKVMPSSQGAAGTGSAGNAAGTVAASIGGASGTGAAGSPGASESTSAGVGTGAGAAGGPASSVAVGPGTGTGTGTANNPTVTTGSDTNAPAGVATGTGTAFAPTVTIGGDVSVNAQVATGTGQAFNPSVSVPSSGGGAVSANPGYGKQVRRDMTRKPSIEKIRRETVLVATNAHAGVARGTGRAYDPTVVTFDHAQDEMDLEVLLAL